MSPTYSICPLFTSASLRGKEKVSDSAREKASTGSLLLAGIPNNSPCWWCCAAQMMSSEGCPSIWGKKELLFVASSDMLGLGGLPLLGGEIQDTILLRRSSHSGIPNQTTFLLPPLRVLFCCFLSHFRDFPLCLAERGRENRSTSFCPYQKSLDIILIN